MEKPCKTMVSEKSRDRLSEAESEQLLMRMNNMAEERAKQTGQSKNEALRDIAGELKAQEGLMGKIYQRNQLLNLKAKDRMKDFAKRFPTYGEGLLAYLEGSNKAIEGARNSVDYNSKAIHGKYFGRLISDLEKEGVLGEFRRGELAKEIYQEMGELGKSNGKPGISGSEKAAKIAKVIESTYSEMIARQNRAGAFIMKLPGYIARQTHDMTQIRLAGGEGNSAKNKSASFKAWSEFTLPLLDPQKTFQGADPMKFMRNVHDGLYTGVHGPNMDAAQLVGPQPVTSDFGKRTSQSRVLYFKDADSAFKYNQEFGIKHIRDQVFSDLWYRSRSIGLMEGLGPNPEESFNRAALELKQEAREGDDAAKHVDSLGDWRLQAALNTVTGKNDIPANFGFARAMGTFRNMVQLAKMGAVTVMKSFGDKAFLQSEMAHQGISRLDTFMKQFSTLFPRSVENHEMLRMMGIGMDGLIGNTQSRYTMHTTVSGLAHRAQQRFYDVNLMNWWTDIHKAAAAELMSGHLGLHADKPFAQLPEDLQRVLNLYELHGDNWEAIRKTAWDNKTGNKFVTPDMIKNIPESTIDDLVTQRELKVTDANRSRVRDELETKLRTYLSDRTDIAVPTPGAAERKYLTLNTQAGTPLGEAMRLLTMFKSFPVTIANKVIARDVYGNGANSIGQWLMNDHRGKFNLAQMVAMTFAAGYLGSSIKEMIKGRTPKPLMDEQGQIQWQTVNDAMIHGGGMGIMGDYLLNEYDSHYRGFLSQAAGPVFGQLDEAGNAYTAMKEGKGKEFMKDTGKLALDNTPGLNLFYIRPIFDYFVLWNLQEMMDPGSLEKSESRAEKQGQKFFYRPSQIVRSK